MTSSEMASIANTNRRKKLGEKGYSKYMKELSQKATKVRVDKLRKDNKQGA